MVDEPVTSEAQSEAERELRLVRERHNINCFDDLEFQRRIAVTRATEVAKELCPSGPVIYAAKLLGISRSRLRRLKIRYKLVKVPGE